MKLVYPVIRGVRCISATFLLMISIASCRKHLDAIPLTQTQMTTPNVIELSALPVLEPHVKKIGTMIGGYYSGLPAAYHQTLQKYPLLVSLHGAGQIGDGNNDLPFVLNDGVPALLAKNKFPASFRAGDENFSFIIVAPQFNQYPSDGEIEAFVDFACREYRVDSSRIYLTGLSMGGILTSEMGGEYTSRFAAIVPMSGVSIDENTESRCKKIADGKLPVWVFHNDNDPKISVTEPLFFISTINKYSPAIAPRLTIFKDASHDSWSQAIDPGYKENGLNIYEWMLQYTR